MPLSKSQTFVGCALAAPALFLLNGSAVEAQVRIASYNIEADIGGYTTPRPGLDAVLQGIGTDSFGGFAKPLDILGLEETTSNATTVAPIVTNLNAFYGSGTYAMSTYQGTVSGGDPSMGNGPNALIYNTKTLTLVASVGVGTPGGATEARQEIRYQFRPAGYGSNADFYVYVGHYKSGSDSTGTNNSETRRNIEANLVRGDAAANLPAGSRIIYSGDFNPFKGSAEPEWVTMTTTTGTGSLSSNAGIDPINLGNGTWGSSNSAFKAAYTDSTTSLKYRDDLQLSTGPLQDGHGFSYIAGTYHPFSNNGNVSVNGGSPNANVKSASDHYPVVADYRLPAKMSTVVTSNVPATVIVGASVPLTVTVTNAAPVAFAGGADSLDYSVSSSGSASGSASITGLAALNSANSTLQFDTSTTGLHSGSISVNSTSQEVADGSYSESFATNVIDHAHPSVSATVVDFGVYGRGLGTATRPFSVSNDVVETQSAGLDLDSAVATGDTGNLSANIKTFSNLGAGGAKSFTASLAANVNGSYATSYDLNLSDQNLLGAATFSTQTVLFTGIIATPGDANLDGRINADDYAHIDSGYQVQQSPGFEFSWATGDFDRNGIINADDYALIDSNYQLQGAGIVGVDAVIDWLAAGDPTAPLPGVDAASLREISLHWKEFGSEYASAFSYSVPEPTTAGILLLTGIASQQRRHRRRC